jgi:predicted XRE-type DNA-binding protein
MKAKRRGLSEHGVRDVTPTGRSVFRDLFPTEEAAELEIRSTLLRGLERWLAAQDMTQTQAAKALGVTQARVSDIKRGKINQFSLDLLVRLAARAGLHPRMRLLARRKESTAVATQSGVRD